MSEYGLLKFFHVLIAIVALGASAGARYRPGVLRQPPEARNIRAPRHRAIDHADQAALGLWVVGAIVLPVFLSLLRKQIRLSEAGGPGVGLVIVSVLYLMLKPIQGLTQQALDVPRYFHDTRNMEMKDAVDALAALAQETRLQVYRLLVEAGPEGLPAGRIGEELGLPPATLSFHLAHLARAGLAQSRQVGRFVIYSADFQSMNALVGYLTENCCGGGSCAPLPTTSKGKAHETLPRARRRA